MKQIRSVSEIESPYGLCYHPDEYPCIEHLYKMENGVCYHVDTGMCFEAHSDSPSIAFDISEPRGGFNYVKPEPKKKTSFLDLFK